MGKQILNANSFISNALSQIKFLVPFFETVKILEYGKEVLDLLSKVNKEDNSREKNINDALFIYLGTNINDNSPHVDHFI